MSHRRDLPIKFISMAVTAYGFYSIWELIDPYSTNMELGVWLVIGIAISYSFTFVGMAIYGRELNTGGIYKLASFIALFYLLNTPTIYNKCVDLIVDGRYSTIKKEYALLPAYNPGKVNKLKNEQKTIVSKYRAYVKNSYEKYINAQKENPKYSYYLKLKTERSDMKNGKDKRNSAYSIAVGECNGYDLSQKSKSVARCQKDLEVQQLKKEYERDNQTAMKDNGIYFVDSIPFTKLHEKEILANSSETSNKARKNKKQELMNIESKFIPMWMIGILVYFIGFFFESRVANMSVFAESETYRKSINGETNIKEELVNRKSEAVQARLNNERENINRLLSSSEDMLRFLYSVLYVQDGEYNQKSVLGKIRVRHASFFAVLKSIMIENPPHLGIQKNGFSEKTIQSHMDFINPKKRVPFSVKNHHVKIREIIEKEHGAKRVNGEWIFDFIALRKILIKVDNLK